MRCVGRMRTVAGRFGRQGLFMALVMLVVWAVRVATGRRDYP